MTYVVAADVPANFWWESNFTDRCELYTHLHLDRPYHLIKLLFSTIAQPLIRFTQPKLGPAQMSRAKIAGHRQAQQMSRLGFIAALTALPHVHDLTITSRSLLIGILKKTTRIPMTLTSVAHSPETAAFHIRPSCKSKILHTATSTDMTSCKAKPMPEIPRGGR